MQLFLITRKEENQFQQIRAHQLYVSSAYDELYISLSKKQEEKVQGTYINLCIEQNVSVSLSFAQDGIN